MSNTGHLTEKLGKNWWAQTDQERREKQKLRDEQKPRKYVKVSKKIEIFDKLVKDKRVLDFIENKTTKVGDFYKYLNLTNDDNKSRSWRNHFVDMQNRGLIIRFRDKHQWYIKRVKNNE